MSDASPMLDVLAVYSADGYTASFWAVEGGLVRCGVCHQTTPAREVAFDALCRLEGTSDPDDMVAVLALRCRCGARGTAVLHYGPMATVEESDVLAAIEDRRPADTPGVAP